MFAMAVSTSSLGKRGNKLLIAPRIGSVKPLMIVFTPAPPLDKIRNGSLREDIVAKGKVKTYPYVIRAAFNFLMTPLSIGLYCFCKAAAKFLILFFSPPVKGTFASAASA